MSPLRLAWDKTQASVFAIPVDRVKRFLPELIEHGKVIRAYHGIVTLMETDAGLKIANSAAADRPISPVLRGFRILRRQRRQGNVIYTDTRVDRDYADTIMAIDGQPVTDHNEFSKSWTATNRGSKSSSLCSATVNKSKRR